jgi:uncharacterized protein (DUF1697 family)
VPKYTALLRGVNLGGRRLKMDELRRAFADWGFGNPATILASGNVVFESDETDPAAVKAAVESGMQSSFGFASTALIRTAPQIAALVAADPAKGLKVTKDTKLHVTFLEEPLGAGIKLPYKSSEPDFEVRAIDPLHLFDIVTLGPKTGTVDLMDFLGKTFGDSATTRTWNTVLKIHAQLQDA